MTKAGTIHWDWLPLKLETAMKMKDFPFFKNTLEKHYFWKS